MEPTQTLNQTQASTASTRVAEARIRLENLRNYLESVIIGHTDAINALLLALIAREHVVMIGPPGTAKTFLVNAVADALNAPRYMYLMTKYSIPDELIGPIDVATLAKEGRLVRRWSAIVTAKIVFLDEVFKASSSILNSLLSFMQERVLYDPITGSAVQTQLWTLVGASNEVPQEEELQAVYDRFAFKTFLWYIGRDADMVAAALRNKWLRPTAARDAMATMADIEVLHDAALSLLRQESTIKLYQVYMVPLFQLIKSSVSDRTVIEKMPKAFAAMLAMRGEVSEEAAIEAAYSLIKYVARSPDELAEIDKALMESLGEVADLYKKLEEGKRLYGLRELNSAMNILKDVAAFDIEKVKNKPWLIPRVKSIISEAQQYISLIQRYF